MVVSSGTDNYWGWTGSTFFRYPPLVERAEVSSLLSVPFSWTPPPAGGSVPLLLGGMIYQSSPAETYAPLDLGPAQFAVQTVLAAEESEALLLLGLPAMFQAGPVKIWLPIPHEDQWLIPDAAKTEWTHSREHPYGWGQLVTDFEPIVKLITPDDRRASADIVLTRSASSPPSAGEYYVDVASNATSIETVDISASAGKRLSCLYYPVRQWGGKDDDQWGISSQQGIGGIALNLSLTEHVPRRVYAGLD